MKTKSVYIWLRQDGTTTAKATIEVPGLGDVEIEQALSDDLRNIIAEEAQTALRVKLGQVVTANAESEASDETV